MSLSRRHLFRVGQAWLAAAALPKSMFAAPQRGNALASLGKESFVTVLGSTFAANASSMKPTWLVLQFVDDLDSSSGAINPSLAASRQYAAPATEGFVLRFSGVGKPLSQGTYEFEHSSLGAIQMFIVPLGRAGYAAVFNRIKGSLPTNYPIPIRKSSVGAPAAQ
jgi:hypothetical protein